MNKAAVNVLTSIFCMTSIVMADSSNIVTFSAKEVMSASETGQMLQTKLQAEQDKIAAPLRKEAESIQQKEQKLIEKSKSDKADSSELEFEKRELNLQLQKLQVDSRKLEEQFAGIYQKEMVKFEQELKKTVEELGEANKWDVVLVEEQVFWANPKLSKTSEIKLGLDKRMKAANQAKKEALAKKTEPKK
ncbi:OmpH family outer membrane protein [Candidatus Babeliales bacterium]|nr:OmpH family outer membrane protein [Candidatus Babeliales bacterium]